MDPVQAARATTSPHTLLSQLTRPLAFGCCLALGACTMVPHSGRHTRKPSDDTRFAEQSAHAGLKGEDGFSVPRAQDVAVSDAKPAAAPPANELPSSELGLASISWGNHSPFSDDGSNESRPYQKGTWQLKRSIAVNEGYLYKVMLTADEQGIVTLSGESGTIYHYELTTGKLLNKVTIPNFTTFEDIDFTVIKEIKDRSQLLISRGSGASLLDLQSGRFDPLTDIPPGDGIAQTPIFGLYGTSLRRTEPQSGQLSFYWLDGSLSLRADCRERPDDYSLSNDGKLLALSYYPSNVAQLLDLEHKKLIAEFSMPQYGGSVALSPDKSLIALGGAHLELRRVSDLSLVGQDLSLKNNIHEIVFSPGGDSLLVSAYDGKIRSYALPADLSSLKALPTPQLLNHNYMSNVYGLALSSDARTLVSSSGDQTLKIWTR